MKCYLVKPRLRFQGGHWWCCTVYGEPHGTGDTLFQAYQRWLVGFAIFMRPIKPTPPRFSTRMRIVK